MSDWKSRATPVDDTSSTSDWKSRATPTDSDSSSILDTLKDAGTGAMQGATLGFGDEMLGARDAIEDKLKQAVGASPKSDKSLAELYRQYQQQHQADVDQATSRSPIASRVGEVAGGLAPAIATFGGSVPEQAAVTGGGRLAQLAANLGPQMLKSGGISAVAAAGGSKGTIDQDPATIAKDSAMGFGTGLMVPPVLMGAGKVIGGAAGLAGNALSPLVNMAKDSPLLQDMLNTYKYNKSGAQSFFGKAAGPEIANQIDQISGNVANQFMQPIKDSSKLYGQTLQDAADKGATLPTDSQPLNDSLDAAKNLILGTPATDDAAAQAGRGGLTPEMRMLLEKHGTIDPTTGQPQALNPLEAKQLQLALRALDKSKGYSDTNVISDATKALNTGIDQSLPQGQLADINNKFSQARSVVEPLINKGEIDPNFQTKSIGDIDSDDVAGKLKTYLKGMLPKTEASNTQGDTAKATWDNVLQNIKDTNAKNQTQFVDPDQIASQVQDMATKANLRKQAVGVDSNSGSNMGSMGGPLQFLSSAPLRAAEYAGKVANGASKKLPELGRNLYQATDDGLQSVAASLNASGHTQIADSLSNALENKSDNAKNATLFTIMQNPNYRQAVFGKDSNPDNQDSDNNQ